MKGTIMVTDTNDDVNYLSLYEGTLGHNDYIAFYYLSPSSNRAEIALPAVTCSKLNSRFMIKSVVYPRHPFLGIIDYDGDGLRDANDNRILYADSTSAGMASYSPSSSLIGLNEFKIQV